MKEPRDPFADDSERGRRSGVSDIAYWRGDLFMGKNRMR